MKISANQLASHLKSSLLPCYMVTGDEHLLVQEEPATMLLVLLRFLQQSWHTMIQPRVLWVAPRVLTPSVSHSAHVPMVWVWGWMVIKVSVVVGSSFCAPFG